jgi:thiol-disulfide isomerase/thioredoxin
MGNIVRVILLLCLYATTLHAQDKLKKTDSAAITTDTLKPYQKYPVLPAFNVLEMDSSTIFNTFNIPSGKPIALMLFSPDCKHCKRTIKALQAGMDSIQNIQFYLVTASHNMADIKEFYEKHHLADYKNIKLVGRDMEFFYFSYYGAKFVPDIALYDEHKKLVKLIEGETNASEVYKYIH